MFCLYQAWVLETAEKLWVAERVEGGARNISNCMSITTKYYRPCWWSRQWCFGCFGISTREAMLIRIDRESAGLRERARREGWWGGEEVTFSELSSSCLVFIMGRWFFFFILPGLIGVQNAGPGLGKGDRRLNRGSWKSGLKVKKKPCIEHKIQTQLCNNRFSIEDLCHITLFIEDLIVHIFAT